MKFHKETFMQLEKLGEQYPSYQPTFQFPGQFIDASHKFYSTCKVDDSGILIQLKQRRWFGPVIQGWLRRDDALKLYEMAYFSNGDILELGSYHGLSTSILSQASQNSPNPKKIISVEMDPILVKKTKETLCKKRLISNVEVICDDAINTIQNLLVQQKKFGFVFIDHSHTYEAVYQVCCQLHKLIYKDGFCLFHDFNDPRNREDNDKDYGVYQAVLAGLKADEFEFCGIYGCTALYRAI